MGPDGQVFDVSFQHRDPEMAAMLANRYTASYIDAVLERTGTSNAAAQRFLEDRAGELQRKVDEGERALQNYRQKYNLVSLEESQNIIVDRLKKHNTALTEARIDRLAVDAKVSQVQPAKENGKAMLEIPVIAQFGSIQRILHALEDAQGQHAELARKYYERHPSMEENKVLHRAAGTAL